jgi:hypothetical protein
MSRTRHVYMHHGLRLAKHNSRTWGVVFPFKGNGLSSWLEHEVDQRAAAWHAHVRELAGDLQADTLDGLRTRIDNMVRRYGEPGDFPKLTYVPSREHRP